MSRLNRFACAHLVNLLVAMAAACISSCGASAPLPGQSDAAVQRMTSEHFVLSILPDTYIAGGQADSFSIVERPAAAETLIDVSVKGARQLKALYFHMDFNPKLYSPGRLDSTWRLAAKDECLSLLLSDPSGVLEYGELIVLPQEPGPDGKAKGFSGDALLCTLHIRHQAMSALRAGSKAPAGSAAKVELSLDPATRTLSWGYRDPGDYDQNGRVAVNDLSPIGIHFLKHVPADPDSIESVVDGGGDGIVNIGDLTPIGINFQRQASGYHIYASNSLDDYPADDGPSIGLATAQELLSAATGTPGSQRLRFSHAFPTLSDGVYLWVRPFEGSNEGSVSNTVQYSAPNQAPSAALDSDVQSGATPLNVNFDAGASADSDGSIVKYEFDFDGDGPLDFVDNGASPQAQHSYLDAGSFDARVRVTDNEGATATASRTVTPGGSGQAPLADLQYSPSQGLPPLSVDFDGSASGDADGSIVLYEWDFDGDGTYDASGPAAQTQHEYAVAGTYAPALRVTDDDGLSAVDSGQIIVDATLTDPVAEFSITPDSGPAPLNVQLDAAASFDPDGSISLYEWDFENDGSYDESSAQPQTVHQFAAAGSYTVRLRVTDNDSRSGSVTHGAAASEPGAAAVLLARPRYGAVPLDVQFDAAGSSSAFGTITKYEWDWDHDGVYDFDSGATAVVSHTFNTPGVYDATVRVTDDSLHTDTAVMLVLATADASFPPDDSIFALPSQSFAFPGEVVGVEVYCKGCASPLLYPYCRLTMPSGNHYSAGSYNPGMFGGTFDSVDGALWEAANPSGFLNVPDFLIQETDVGGGRIGIDLVVTPLGGTEVPAASGPLLNIGLVVNSSIDFGFLRMGEVEVTYYQSGVGNHYNWSNESNTGLPGINLL